MSADLAPWATAALAAAAVVAAPPRDPGVAAGVGADQASQRWPPPGGGRRRPSEAVIVSPSDVLDALVLLALTFRAGLPVCDVLEAVAGRCRQGAETDLRQVATALRWGASDEEAWGSVGPRWLPAARAIALAGRAGVPPGPLLLRAADDLGHGELERLDVAAAKVTVRLVLPLGLVLLPAFVLTTVLPIVAALAREVFAAT